MRRGFTLVEIMIVVAIIALLAAIAIPNLLTARRTANEAASKANLKSLATGAETYASANNGNYPASTAALSGFVAMAAQLCGATIQGYSYNCGLLATGYNITATPASATSGTVTYNISTGGVLTPP